MLMVFMVTLMLLVMLFFVIANIAVFDVHIDAVVVNCVADGVACVSGVFP